MRLLVACGECKRRYDASKRPIGSRFRCRCGTVLTVGSPRGYDARVVRCSSCGAARQKGRLACTFCGDDFTLHERDLHTVCPECLTRVSDRAKFCHHCATPLFGGETVGDWTSRLCPACAEETRLHSRQLGGKKVSASECDGCAGFWLGNEAFEHLARRARSVQPVSVVTRRKARSRSDVATPLQRAGYRPCPICTELMNRTNYGLKQKRGGSGTLIDVCREHGIWFDATELARILDWLRQGGQARPVTAPRRSSAKRVKMEETTCPDCAADILLPAVTCPMCQSELPQSTRKERGRSKTSASLEELHHADFSDFLPDVAHKLGAMLGSLFDV